jgi:N-acetylmuramoyl-L-alanine amidase
MTRRVGIAALLVAVVVLVGAVVLSAMLEVSNTTASLSPPATTTITAELPPVTLVPTTPQIQALESTTTMRGLPIAVPDDPLPEPPAPAPATLEGFTGTGIVTVAAGGADLAANPAGPAFVRAREGLVFPADAIEGDWVRILTTCDEDAWVNLAEIRAEPAASGLQPGPGTDFADAVIVVDAGHGGPNIGTSSPDGTLPEKAVNLDIARRLRDLLEQSHSVDWDSGTLYNGDEIPAASRVIMTRVGVGETGDYEAGLIYRASLANRAGAHVLMSIHNNAGWEIALDHPGSDVFYQSQLVESRRLAELLVEEFQLGFAGFDADWVGAIEWGAKSRLSPRDEVSQYYGILRRAEMPAVIAEGAYLANSSEARLLATSEFRQAYAAAAYRAIVRFVTSNDVARTPTYDPVVWAGFAGSGDPVDTCAVPAQSE